MKRTIWLFLFLLTVGALFPSCFLQEKCSRDETGTFFVINSSQDAKSYDVKVDGKTLGTVTYGEKVDWTVPMGTHVVNIVFTDTQETACYSASVYIYKCESVGLTCYK